LKAELSGELVETATHALATTAHAVHVGTGTTKESLTQNKNTHHSVISCFIKGIVNFVEGSW